MRYRILAFLLAFAPVMVWAQAPQEKIEPTPLTEKLLMTQRPAGISVEQWAKMIRNPVNATLYPIRLTQGMLDTLDASKLDLRYQYVLIQN